MTYISQVCASLSGRNKSEHFLGAHHCKLFNSIKFTHFIFILYNYMTKGIFGMQLSRKENLSRKLIKRKGTPVDEDLLEI